MIKNVAIYVRVSTVEQAMKGFSLDAQIDKLCDYCKCRDWNIYKVFVDDGYSGRNVKRKGYKCLMEEIDMWDTLLVIKMDRIHRNSKNFVSMMELLEKRGKDFVSMSETFDTSTAIGRFVMSVIQRIAQLESEQIGERVIMGMEQKAKNGNCYLGRNLPYGYEYVNKKYVVNKEERKIIKEIFDMYLLDGKGMKSIAEELNRLGVKSKRGKLWRNNTIGKILKNPFYCGYVRWNGYISKGKHERIIDKDDFLYVQECIKKNGGKPFEQVLN